MKEAIAPLLADWLGAGGEILDTTVEVRRHVPGKRLIAALELRVGRADGRPTERRRIIAKLYPKDKGQRVYEILRQLWVRGFDEGPFLVPEPLAFDPAWRLLLLSWASGESFRSLLLTRKNGVISMQHAAMWLLRLHTCGVSSGRQYDFSRHLHTLALHRRLLSEVCERTGRRFAEIAQSVEATGRAVAGWRPGPTHRDFSPEHLLINGDRLTGLDFDEFCQYDPLFDVAHFIAHLKFLGLTCFGALHHYDAAADCFHAAYQANAPEYCSRRLHLYQAISYLKLAYIVTVVRRPSDHELVAGTLLREAQRCL